MRWPTENMLTLLANLGSGDQQNITTGTLLNGDSLASGYSGRCSSVAEPARTRRHLPGGCALYAVDFQLSRETARAGAGRGDQYFHRKT